MSDPASCRPGTAAETPGTVSNLAKQGAVWVLLTNGVKFAVGFGVSVTLARLLGPADFGTVAMATVFFEVSHIVGNFGMAGALVQRRSLADVEIDVAFWTSTLAGAVLTALFVALAIPASRFFHNPVVAPVMGLMALSVLLNSMSATAVALLDRRLAFRQTALLGLLSSGVNGAVAILLAIRGFGPWSLVWAALAAAAIHLAAAQMLSGYRPRARFDRAAFRGLSGYGGYLSLKNVFVYLSRNLDQFVIGRRLGDAALGHYSRGINLMSIPQREFVSQLNRVAFPAFSRIQDDPGMTRDWFLKGARTVSLLTIPVLLALVVLAEDFTRVVYGEPWMPMAPALQILSVAGIFRLVQALGVPVIEASGKLRLETLVGVGDVVLILGGGLVGSFWGIEGVAAAVAFASLATCIARGFLLRRFIGLPIGVYLRVPLPALLASTGAALAAVLVRALLADHAGRPALLAAGVLVFAAVYAGLVLGFWREDCRPLLAVVQRLRALLPVSRRVAVVPGGEL